MKICTYIIFIFLLFPLSGYVFSERIRIDNVPMYGQPEVVRPDKLKKTDEEFIRQVSATFFSRNQASEAWWVKGEQYRKEGNFDFAMRRYNQSWLLDPNNYQPYWGFGLVLAQQGKIDNAIKYLKMSEKLINDDYQKAALLSDLGFAYINKALNDPSYFNKADSLFAESTKLDPTYGNTWGNWAYSLYHQGRYKEAWDKVHKSKEVNSPAFSAKFISDLKRKLPDPNAKNSNSVNMSSTSHKKVYKSKGHEKIPYPAPDNCMWIRDSRTQKYELDC